MTKSHFKKKDYELIEEQIWSARQDAKINNLNGLEALYNLSTRLAVVFKNDNARFDTAKFLKHCKII